MSPPNEPSAELAETNAAMLRAYVAGRDVSCPGCGYNVRDLVGEVCPECGQRLTLSVRLQDPRQAALIAGLVGLSAGAGLGGLLLIYAAIVISTQRTGLSFWDRFVLVNAIGFVVHAAGVAAWVWKWNAIRVLPAVTRRLLVIGCFALPLTYVAIFAITIK